MVVEADAGRTGRPSEDGLGRHGPDALLGALLDQHQAVGRHAQQALGLADGAAAGAKVVDQHLPAHGAALHRVRYEARLQPLLLAAAERQDGELGAAVQRVRRHVIRRQILINQSIESINQSIKMRCLIKTEHLSDVCNP